MTEQIRYTKIYREDLALGTGTEEVTLADGQVVALHQIDIEDLTKITAYGAVGDNLTDNASVIQTAIDTCVGKDLVFGPGIFLVSVRLKPASGQSWHGVTGQTVIKLSNAAASTASVVQLNADGTEGSLDDFSASGIIFDGNGKDCAFLLYGCQRLRMVDCVFRNAGTYGFALQARPGQVIATAQDDITLTRCGFEDNGTDAPNWDGLDIKYCTNTHLVSCWSRGNTKVGMNIRGLDVTMTGCVSDGDGTGILLQATDPVGGGYPSSFALLGCTARNATGVGLQIQGDTNNATYINIASFHSSTNGTTGVEFSGSGLIYGTLSGLSSISNTGSGIVITGNYVGRMIISNGLILSNGSHGISNTGKNVVFDAMQIISNTGTGYKEETGADNNYLMPNCVIASNGTDMTTRVGSETASGFMAVRAKQSIRFFPGQTSGLELQTDSGGTHSSLVTVGDAATIDLRLMTKGNGNITGYKDNGSRTAFEFREEGSTTVNYPAFVASLTTSPVRIQAQGSDTNIDLELEPKGTGNVRFGTHTGGGDTTSNGYITIKDSAGNTRKIMTTA